MNTLKVFCLCIIGALLLVAQSAHGSITVVSAGTAVAIQSAGPTIGSSFTVQVLGTATNIRSAEADRSVAATGTFAPIWTYGTSTLAMAGQVAFKLSNQIKGSVFIW